MLIMKPLLKVGTFFMPLVIIVFCKFYKDFHFISNPRFGYYSFSYRLLGYNINRPVSAMISELPRVQ